MFFVNLNLRRFYKNQLKKVAEFFIKNFIVLLQHNLSKIISGNKFESISKKIIRQKPQVMPGILIV